MNLQHFRRTKNKEWQVQTKGKQKTSREKSRLFGEREQGRGGRCQTFNTAIKPSLRVLCKCVSAGLRDRNHHVGLEVKGLYPDVTPDVYFLLQHTHTQKNAHLQNTQTHNSDDATNQYHQKPASVCSGKEDDAHSINHSGHHNEANTE